MERVSPPCIESDLSWFYEALMAGEGRGLQLPVFLFILMFLAGAGHLGAL